MMAALVGVSCGLDTSLFAQATPTPSPTAAPLSSYTWAASASPNLAVNPPPLSSAQLSLDNLANLGEQVSICSYHFANLHNAATGNLSLIASVEKVLGDCA